MKKRKIAESRQKFVSKNKAPQQKTDAALVFNANFYNSTVAKILLLFVITAIVYVPAMQGEFLWDDRNVIRDNVLLRSTDGLWKIWTAPAYNKYEVHYWPIVYSTFWFEYHLWEQNTLGYHLVNIFLHSINSALLWLLLKRLLVPGAYFAAVLFAIHPVHVESVAWMVELKDVLSGMFYLLAILIYMEFDAQKNRRTYILSLFLFVVAMLSKTIVVTLPIAILLILWWKKNKISKNDIFYLLPFFFAGIFITIGDILFTSTLGKFKLDLSFLQRCIIAGRVIWFYASKVFLPLHLVAIYPKWEINAKAILQYIYPLSATAVIALLWIKKHQFGKGPLIAVLYFIVTLFPVLGFRTIDYMKHSYAADRFQYLASTGLFVLFSAIITTIAERSGAARRWIQYDGSALLILILGIITLQQSALYKDIETLFRYNLTFNPDSPAVHNNIAVELSRKGNIKEAAIHFSEVLKFDPDDASAHNNLGMALAESGKIDEAIAHYKEALRIDYKNGEAYSNYGVALAQKGELEKAIPFLKKAVKLHPSNYNFQYNLANGLSLMEKYQEAIPYLLEAIQLNPKYAEPHNNLGTAYIKTGKIEDAVFEYRKALEINPGLLEAARNLAWLLATNKNSAIRNGIEAVQLAEYANEHTNSNFPEILDTLAAAYAESERFSDAIQTAQKALNLARQRNQERIAKDIDERLQLYREAKPFRE